VDDHAVSGNYHCEITIGATGDREALVGTFGDDDAALERTDLRNEGAFAFTLVVDIDVDATVAVEA